jgi:hypothetical protein
MFFKEFGKIKETPKGSACYTSMMNRTSFVLWLK